MRSKYEQDQPLRLRHRGRPARRRLYDAQITDRWQVLHGTPLGSYPLAVAVGALGRQLAQPLAASAHFLRPVEVGPAQGRAEVARTGRRMATGEASVWQNDEERLRAVATFTDFAGMNGRTARFDDPPRLPSPEKCLDPLDGVSDADPLALVLLWDVMAPLVLEGRPDQGPEMVLQGYRRP